MRLFREMQFALFLTLLGTVGFLAWAKLPVLGQSPVGGDDIHSQIEKHVGLYDSQKSILLGILRSIDDREFLTEAGLVGEAHSEMIWQGTRVFAVCHPTFNQTIAIVLLSREPDASLNDRTLYIVSFDNANRKGAFAIAGKCRSNSVLNDIAFEDTFEGKIKWNIKITDITGTHEFSGKVGGFEAINLRTLENNSD